MGSVTSWRGALGDPATAFGDLESDPLRSGYIRTFAQPSGNLTGIFLDQPELAGKWLQLLREVAPGLSNAAVIWDAETGTSQLDAARAAAQRLGIQLQVVPLSPDLDGLFNAIKAGPAQGLILLSSPKAQEFAEQVVEFCSPCSPTNDIDVP